MSWIANSLYEMRLQGVCMVAVFITLDCIFVLMTTTTMQTLWRRVSHRKLRRPGMGLDEAGETYKRLVGCLEIFVKLLFYVFLVWNWRGVGAKALSLSGSAYPVISCQSKVIFVYHFKSGTRHAQSWLEKSSCSICSFLRSRDGLFDCALILFMLKNMMDFFFSDSKSHWTRLSIDHNLLPLWKDGMWNKGVYVNENRSLGSCYVYCYFPIYQYIINCSHPSIFS